jgi:hypothetical protein
VTFLLLLLAAQDPVSPWRPGATWTWSAGERRLSAEVWDKVDLGSTPCVRLRFRHLAECKPWGYEDLFLSEQEGSLLLAGYSIEDRIYLPEKPTPLFPKDPAVGRKWTGKFENGSMKEGEYRWQDAAFLIEAKERISSPLGVFDAWKILFAEPNDGSEGIRLWISPVAGVLRIESLSAKHDRKPWILNLASMDLKRPDRFTRYPEPRSGALARLEELLPGLRHADAARRGAAEKAIRELGAGAIPELRRRAAAEADVEVRARLEAAARSFGAFKVEARAAKATIAVGERLPIEIVLKNDGPEPIVVLPCLPDATMNLGRKYPAIRSAVTGPDGQPVELPIFGSFWSAPRLSGRDFRRLLPGESLEVFAEGEGGVPPELAAEMKEAGTYTIRMIYDVLGPEAADWVTDSGPPDEEALRLLRSLPRGRFELAPVKVTVVPKK